MHVKYPDRVPGYRAPGYAVKLSQVDADKEEMKIYCLLLDAVPWSGGNVWEGGGLAAIAKENGMQGLSQVSCGMFTTTT